MKVCLLSHIRNSVVTIVEYDQWEKYYRYWTREAVRVNDLLQSKDQLLGCSYFDSSRKHFEILFHDWDAQPVMFNRIRPVVVLELACATSSNVAQLLEYRFTGQEGKR